VVLVGDAIVMTQYFAFLRVINVGGHKVKMNILREKFESLGFSRIETFIASGNVVFESPFLDIKTLEKMIETELKKLLDMKSPL
jgi:uncharacterized protein (DUF1697 family)